MPETIVLVGEVMSASDRVKGGLSPMPLINERQRSQLLRNADLFNSEAIGEAWPAAKLYTLDAHATWLLVSLDPEDFDTAYGLCDLGIGTPSLGYIKLSDLQAIRGPRDMPVCCDTYFVARYPLSEYVRRAEANGSITD